MLNLLRMIVFITLFSISGVSFAFAEQDAWTGNANILLGGKTLDEDDWEPAERQGEFGIEIDFRKKDWPINIAIDLLGAAGEETEGFTKRESRTSEFNIGVRKVWGQFPHLRPFIGGGLSFIRAEDEVTVLGFTVSDDDSGTGIWLGGGVYWTLEEHFNIGFELKSSFAEVTLFNKDVNAGGGHFGFLAGYHW